LGGQVVHLFLLVTLWLLVAVVVAQVEVVVVALVVIKQAQHLLIQLCHTQSQSVLVARLVLLMRMLLAMVAIHN
jgi:hypothetical protein